MFLEGLQGYLGQPWPIRENIPNPREIESLAQWLKIVLRSMNFQDKNAMKMPEANLQKKKRRQVPIFEVNFNKMVDPKP
jgi:hypothetical protein